MLHGRNLEIDILPSSPCFQHPKLQVLWWYYRNSWRRLHGLQNLMQEISSLPLPLLFIFFCNLWNTMQLCSRADAVQPPLLCIL